jgi:hypothetical protein
LTIHVTTADWRRQVDLRQEAFSRISVVASVLPRDS